MLIGLGFALFFAPFMPRRFGRHSIARRISELYAVAFCGAAVAATTADDDGVVAIAQALKPAQGFPRWTVPGIAPDFLRATSMLTEHRTLTAALTFEHLLRVTAHKRFLLDERLRHELRLGTMNGRGHAYIDRNDGVSLQMADELEKGSPFFAVHAEIIRVLHYMVLGQHDLSEQHRQRAETLALRGGASWSAACSLATRTMEIAFAHGDGAALMRTEAEIERLLKWVPSMQRHLLIARARLMLLRGRAQQAAELLEPALADVHALALMRALRSTYAEALCQLGSFEKAREQALAALEHTPQSQWKFGWIMRTSFLQLARAEVGLGNHEQARRLMLARLEEADARKNPLELGIIHRELAAIALSARDTAAFDRHLALMTAQFRGTQHPNLARQQELLLARAVAAGLKQSPTGTFRPAVGDPLMDSATLIEPRTSRRSLGNED